MASKLVNVLSFLLLLGFVQSKDLQCFVHGECSHSDIIDINPVSDEVRTMRLDFFHISKVFNFWLQILQS